MTEQFATYEISLKLKELGFNEECLAIYINLVLKPIIQKPISGEFNYKFKSVRNSVIVNSENCSAPLWQQVIDWLRVKQCINIVRDLPVSHYCSCDKEQYRFNIIKTLKNGKKTEDMCKYNKIITYEDYYEALTIAILKAIELIKNETTIN